MVIRGRGEESGSDVQCSEFCIENMNMARLCKAVAWTDDFGCFAGESGIRKVFGEDGEELIPAGCGVRSFEGRWLLYSRTR